MCPVTVARYLKHAPTYVKAELSRHKTIYIKMGAITSAVFDGEDCSLVINVGQRVYCLPNMDVAIATEIVSYSVKS